MSLSIFDNVMHKQILSEMIKNYHILLSPLYEQIIFIIIIITTMNYKKKIRSTMCTTMSASPF